MSKYFFICLILLLVLKNNTSGQQQTLSGTYVGMADSLIKAGKYTEAIGMYKLFLDVEQNLSDPDLVKMSESLNNTGVCHFVLRNYHKALSSFNKALDIDLKLDNKKNIATRLNNIGLIYKILGNYDIAIENYLKALKIVNELGDQEN
ncbi:MAG: tetratricopeptide repeat protein, partial [Bacteroidales bacterium]|nr:tetratricopeptide repeat protein [Bacteroidales bacterium]